MHTFIHPEPQSRAAQAPAASSAVSPLQMPQAMPKQIVPVPAPGGSISMVHTNHADTNKGPVPPPLPTPTTVTTPAPTPATMISGSMGHGSQGAATGTPIPSSLPNGTMYQTQQQQQQQQHQSTSITIPPVTMPPIAMPPNFNPFTGTTMAPNNPAAMGSQQYCLPTSSGMASQVPIPTPTKQAKAVKAQGKVSTGRIRILCRRYFPASSYASFGHLYHYHTYIHTHPPTCNTICHHVLCFPQACRIQGCDDPAVARRPYCVKHSGNRLCEFPGCTKCAQGSTRFCIAHGGGRRCTFPGCDKGARDKYFCAA